MSSHSLHMPARQRGAAILGIVGILIFIVTLLTIFSARSTLLEIKTSGNQYRYAQALNAAEYGVEQGIAYLTKNRSVIRNNTKATGWGPAQLDMWTACLPADVTVPCGDGTSNIYGSDGRNWVHTAAIANLQAFTDTSLGATVYFVTEQDDSGIDIPKAYPLITIVATGTADNGNATTVVRRTFKGTSLLVNDLPGPLTVVGNTNLKGNYNIWGNVDGLGPNQPISVWSGGNVTLAGNAKTYDVRIPASNYPNKFPIATVLSDKTNEDIDIIDNSPDFPADLFYFLFGVPRSQSAIIKANADVYADCSSLSTASYGLIWVTGDCDVPDIGSQDNPVIMIVEGEVTQNGNSEIYGIIYIMDTTPVVNMNGTVYMHGAILVDANVDLGNGTYYLHYDSTSISNANDQSGRFSYVEGSWNDEY